VEDSGYNEDDYEYDYSDADGIEERNFPTLTQTDLRKAIRTLLCPICVARRFVFNSLTVRLKIKGLA
jgi:hypothetical protein